MKTEMNDFSRKQNLNGVKDVNVTCDDSNLLNNDQNSFYIKEKKEQVEKLLPQADVLQLEMTNKSLNINELIFQGENGLYAPATAGCEAGPYTQSRGYLGYNEICDRVILIYFVSGLCL